MNYAIGLRLRDSGVRLEFQTGKASIQIDNVVWRNGIHLDSLSDELT